MKIELDLTDEEVHALELLARVRLIGIVAGTLQSAPDDRAIAKLLSAAHQAMLKQGNRS